MMTLAKEQLALRPSKYETRYAVESEREKIADLYIKNLWHIAHIPPDLLTVIRSVYQAVHQGRVILIERSGEIAGCTSFVEGSYWYTPRKMLFDTGFFIVPEFRKTRAASLLLNALKREAKDRNALLVMGAGTKDASVAPIMAKRYQQIGAAFVVTD